MREHGTLDVSVALVAEKVGSATMHGWNTGRLLKVDGSLYVVANKVRPPDADPDDWSHDRGLIFRRQAEGAAPWEQIAEIAPRAYTCCVDPFGRFWTVSPRHFNYVTLWRSGPKMDLDHLTRCYDGTCAYLGTGVGADGNHLLLHAEDANHMIRLPNAMIGLFYDAATDSWHKSRMETPEGRYGYVGILLRGRRAIALLQSTLLDPAAEPEPPHYNWRFLRLARCDDLTKGEWVQRPWLIRKFGQTRPHDLIVAPDGAVYLAYHHRGGDDSYEATQERPYAYRIARIHDDLSVDTFDPGIDPAGSRLFIDGGGRWYAVGRTDGLLHLWRLDPDRGFQATDHWTLPGTEVLQGSILHTLRPERFGGEAGGDTVHLMTSEPDPGRFSSRAGELALWHARFDLPTRD